MVLVFTAKSKPVHYYFSNILKNKFMHKINFMGNYRNVLKFMVMKSINLRTKRDSYFINHAISNWGHLIEVTNQMCAVCYYFSLCWWLLSISQEEIDLWWVSCLLLVIKGGMCNTEKCPRLMSVFWSQQGALVPMGAQKWDFLRVAWNEHE